MKLPILFATVMIVGLCGCRRADRFEASRIVQHDAISSILSQAAADVNTEWRGGGGGADGGVFRARVEIDGEVDEVVRAQFMSSLRLATQKFLADQEATIHG